MDTLEHRPVVTRTEHRCWGCCRAMPPGSRLTRIVEVDAGKISSTYWCEPCRVIMERIIRHYNDPDGFDYGVIVAECREEWWAEYRKTWPIPRSA